MTPSNQYPEAWRLRQIHWQFFVTLTFVNPMPAMMAQCIATFSWLREVAANADTHFKRLLWVRRYELGKTDGRGHFHLCIAGLPSGYTTQSFTRQTEALWRQRTGGLADIRRYQPTRDGIGYILKTAQDMPGLITNQDEQYPTLSKSLFATLRRGRM
jgi:hypothetical protein